MFEALIYWLMNKIGYRKMYFDLASYRGIRLTSYDGWHWRPNYKKGTYRESREGWNYSGYGIDK